MNLPTSTLPSPPEPSSPAGFSGRWVTSFGPMTLRQDGTRVTGTYGPEGTENAIEGTIGDGRLTFRYKEASEQGNGWFRLRRPGCFAGEYIAEGKPRALPWQGWRGFDGLWESPLGRLHLVQDAGRMHGTSEHDVTARIEGDAEGGGRFRFRINGARIKGDGLMQLDQLGYAFSGELVQEGLPAQPFTGRRVLARPGLTWLVVLEAHWQRVLDDNEYAFGGMLHELFARVPWAQVRHRFYQSEASLVHWCRQLVYLPEPAVLVITGHGVSSGLTVDGKIIALSAIVDALQCADSLRLLHFSACLVGQDGGQALGAAPFPVSGYTTSVDWALSALTEFIYLDMIMEKGLAPAKAAEQLLTLVRFSGSEPLPGSPYRPAGFCFFEAHTGHTAIPATATGTREPPRPRPYDLRSMLGRLVGTSARRTGSRRIPG